MLKSCPKCKKQYHAETRICTCGFWFIEHKLAQTTPDFHQPKRERLKKNVIKFSVLTGFVLLVSAAIAVLGGFTDFLQIGEKSKSELLDSPDNPQKTALSSRFPKGRVEGRVLSVGSGDMITILDADNRQFQIKLAGIDAPEPEQEFGEKSKEYLASMILDKNVVVNLQRIEEGGILVGKVILEEKNINLEQIRAGFAVNDKNSLDQQPEYDQQLYADAENSARTSGAGLWVNSKTNAAETSPETVENTTTENPVLENKTVENTEIKNNPTPGLKTENPAPQNEVEIPSGFSSITPAPTPATIVESTIVKTTPMVKESVEAKPSNQAASAIARCADGTLSYSESRSGACSNHGGVASWSGGSNPTPATKTPEKTYTRGSRGGCFYINSNGRKTYVDQSLCN